MRVHLAYGKTGLDIDVPQDRTTVFEPRFQPALPDPQAALRQALAQPVASKPLRHLVTARDRVGIVISDLTRPMPTADVVRAIAGELAHVPDKNITLFIGLGTHRTMTPKEVESVLDAELVRRFPISQTDCRQSDAFTTVGRSKDGNTIRFVTDFLKCSVSIVTGLMEPHLFAGISGGPKGILPGLAAMDTIINNHSPAHFLNPSATWGVTAGNPIWEEIRDSALLAKPTFLVNVAVNKNKEITGVFAGDMMAAFRKGAEFVRETAMVAVPHRYDVVVTTNSGYPLDLNFYQTIKGISAAAQIVKPGGAIIAAAECWDGIPGDGRMAEILRQVKTPEDIIAGLEDGRYTGMDQWQLLVYAPIRQKAEVYLKTSHLSAADVRTCLAEPCSDVGDTLRSLLRRFGAASSACVLPEGPQTVPYVTD